MMAHNQAEKIQACVFKLKCKMLKKSDMLEKNKFYIRVQHPQIYQNQLVLSLSFFLCCTVLFIIKNFFCILNVFFCTIRVRFDKITDDVITAM